jgi:hypothetical protein
VQKNELDCKNRRLQHTKDENEQKGKSMIGRMPKMYYARGDGSIDLRVDRSTKLF